MGSGYTLVGSTNTCYVGTQAWGKRYRLKRRFPPEDIKWLISFVGYLLFLLFISCNILAGGDWRLELTMICDLCCCGVLCYHF